jgi:hypothetical protein
MPVGVLDVRFDLVPATAPPTAAEASAQGKADIDTPHPRASIGVPQSIIHERILQQQRKQDDAGRRFFAYAKGWWAEFGATGQGFKYVGVFYNAFLLLLKHVFQLPSSENAPVFAGAVW